jgi:tetratricopeptide (TPR) repeat protein
LLELVLISIILIVLPLFKWNVKWGGAFVAKEVVFFIISIGYLCILLLTGMKIAGGYSGYFLLTFVIFATCSAMWSSNIEQTWQDIVKWWAMYGLFIMASSLPVNTILVISVIPLPVFLAWGFLQYLDKDPFDKELKAYMALREREMGYRMFLGIGNPNHTGAFLAPYMFIVAYLGINVSPYFYLLLPPLAYGIYLTECYSAILGIVVGACFVYPPYSLFGLLVLAACAATVLYIRKYKVEFYQRRLRRKVYSLKTRFYFVKIALRLWRQNPLFGWGLKTFARESYDMQAIMNKDDPNLLGYADDKIHIPPKYSPFPERVHNDFIEILMESGVIGAILFMAFLSVISYNAVMSGNYVLLAGIICLAVHGCTFYTISAFSYIPYMVLAVCASGATAVNVSFPFILGAAISCVAIKMVISYAIYPLLSMMLVARCNLVLKRVEREIMTLENVKASQPMTEKEIAEMDNRIRRILMEGHAEQERYIDKAVKYTPVNGSVLATAADLKGKIDPWFALHYAERAIHYFDGVMLCGGVWGNYAELLLKCGNWNGAKRAYSYALFLDPTLVAARLTLRNMEQREEAQKEKQVRDQQIVTLLKPNGGK